MIEFSKLQNGLPQIVGQVDFIEPMLNLLAHAQTIELDLGSQCGGHGICGKDRVRISDAEQKNLSLPSESEKRLLSESALKTGVRLACQTYPDALCQSLHLRVHA